MGAKGLGSPSGVSPEPYHWVHDTDPGQTRTPVGQLAGKLAKLVTPSPPPCCNPAAMLRDAGSGLGLAGRDLA